MTTYGHNFVQSATVTLTNAQIVALSGTPVEIVPAPGANKVLIAVAATVQSSIDDMGVPYTGIASPSYLGITYTSQGVLHLMVDADDAALYVESTTSRLIPNWVLPVTSNTVNPDEALVVSSGGQSVFTGGESTNTMTYTVYYLVVDV